jgi:hypothetical protein
MAYRVYARALLHDLHPSLQILICHLGGLWPDLFIADHP